MSTQNLTCWALSDGRRGMENQALGLAEAVAADGGIEVLVKTASLMGLPARLPERLLASGFANPLAHLTPRSAPLEAPWPDLLIGCGRTSVGLSIAIRRAAHRADKKIVTVQTQDPRVSAKCFDLVIPPFHDELRGPNVLPILGAPHRVSATRLEQEIEPWRASVAHLPKPLAAVLIGGTSRAYQMTAEATHALCDQLLALGKSSGCGFAVTASRRTGAANAAILQSRLRGERIWYWGGAGENPYFGMLALADHILVTSDSTNMVTEAASTGKPVHVIHLPGGNKKFQRFHQAMETRGITRVFKGELDHWSYEPLNEATRIAPLIRGRLGLVNKLDQEAAEDAKGGTLL